MTAINLDIDAERFQESIISSIRQMGSENTYEIIGRTVVELLNLQLEMEVQEGNVARYKVLWNSPNYLFERSNTSLFEFSRIPIINLGYFVFEIVTNKKDDCKLTINNPSNLYWTDPPKVQSKELKTICKHKIRLYELGLKSELLNPVVQSLGETCPCSQNYLVPFINGVWDNALQFICKVCGKAYFCQCFHFALGKEYQRILSSNHKVHEGSLDFRLVSSFEQSEFRDRICHLCRGIQSDIQYCHPMYGSDVLVNYGPYIAKTAIEKNITQREAENEVRDILGIPRIGEGWISEAELLNLVQEIFPNEEVVHQASPDWLGRQRLDVFLPERKLAIEYQGRQHYEPVDFFGGQVGFEKTKERDKIKAKLCELNDVKLIYFRYDEPLSRKFVENRIKDINF